MTKVLDGAALLKECAARLSDRIQRFGRSPRLVIVQIGTDPRSTVYINRKKAFGAKIGATVEHIELPATISQSEVLFKVQELSAQSDVDGILVQAPLPEGMSLTEIASAIDPKKDIDGLGAVSSQALLERAKRGNGDSSKGHVPATARGIETLLLSNGISMAGKRVLVVGRSLIVGLPSALTALAHDATITIAHHASKNISELYAQAEIVILGVGVPRFFTKEHARPEHIVIDVGITPEEGGGIVGDVDFVEVSQIVKAISPVPGGVGPMTVASLFENLCDAAGLPKGARDTI